VRRREFIVLFGAAAWPDLGHAQQAERMRRVGVLMPWAEDDPFTQASVRAVAQTLGRSGWFEGTNILIDCRYAAGDPALFKTEAAELVGLSPDAILASTPPAVAAVRERTRTIPIVFVLVVDPVGLGLVHSLARPGGNITGFRVYGAAIMGKWLQLLKEVAPDVTRIAVLFNPQPYAALYNDAIEAAVPSFGMTVTFAPVRADAEIEEAIAAQARQPGGGLISLPDVFTTSHRDLIATAAARHGLPLMGAGAIFPRAGALISYWYHTAEMYAQAASYVDRILKGVSPADLPVQNPTKFSLVINLRTAKALGLIVSPRMLDLADEVIQ
jgi:putative ABC transport system substrate-binding protein